MNLEVGLGRNSNNNLNQASIVWYLDAKWLGFLVYQLGGLSRGIFAYQVPRHIVSLLGPLASLLTLPQRSGMPTFLVLVWCGTGNGFLLLMDNPLHDSRYTIVSQVPGIRNKVPCRILPINCLLLPIVVPIIHSPPHPSQHEKATAPEVARAQRIDPSSPFGERVNILKTPILVAFKFAGPQTHTFSMGFL